MINLMSIISTPASLADFPWLSVSILFPIVSALFIPFIPDKGDGKTIRWYALTITMLTCTEVIVAYFTAYDPKQSGLQLVEKVEWLPILHLNWAVGADGLSMPLIVLSSFITTLAVLAAWPLSFKPKFFYFLILAMDGGQIAVFAAQNMLLFFLTWELELVPVYILLAIWGGHHRQAAATKFILYTALSSIFIFIAALAMNSFGNGLTSFEYTDLANKGLDTNSQIWCYLAFLIAFGVKLPIVPMHTWLPAAHGEATAPVHMLLAGILLKMGGYALLRFNVQMLPEAHSLFAPLLVIFGMINIIYAAFTSFGEENVKKKIAYSSISHMGFVLIGIGSFSDLATTGTMLQMISHGLIGACFFFVIGGTYDRTASLSMSSLGGIAQKMPIMFALWTIVALASLALPGMSGFVSELMVLTGFTTSEAYTIGFRVVITSLAALGIIITPIYLLSMLRQVFFGEEKKAKFKEDIAMLLPGEEQRLRSALSIYSKKDYIDVESREIYIFACLLIPIIGIGLYPRLVTDSYRSTIESLVSMERIAADRVAIPRISKLIRQGPLKSPEIVENS
uniref:NAD(P)H-quinone oxidoreductase subunit 4 n=1 Tax=Paulinella chromatophora TaxID=39717 RepID=B1X492_PAUCH|nr:NAD(P)H-quinone oxidoreductase subunit 4 [Paulinella chromatophora]ACB42761.1 NAD(P)H-quinone oxidoreductase subunit 4 [Paulinella chromatophora]|eukprot:gb/GEZN01004269.1/.p1 GENE.gb/GEZN01004269.1/~~gb/GEZN01004269.1/.p1  ORF type:complete len:565 (-),score=-27.04 gb/GEZN01004269.1/:96-1790(-)